MDFDKHVQTLPPEDLQPLARRAWGPPPSWEPMGCTAKGADAAQNMEGAVLVAIIGVGLALAAWAVFA